MNDERSFERFVADNVAGPPGGIPMPDDFYDDIHSYANQNRQRPEWLALIKEPPMRTNNHLAVGSPTVRVAAVIIATLLLALTVAAAGVAGQRLLAADATIIVDQDGNGHYTSVTEAVAAASDGGTITVRPGTYVESVAVIGKDLTIAGEGDRGEIIIELDPAGEVAEFDWTPYVALAEDAPTSWAFLFADTASRLSGVTVLAPDDEEAILVVGPETDAVLEKITVRSLGEVRGGINAVFWSGGASGALRHSVIEGWVGLNQDSTVVVEDNDMPATCLGVWESGADAVIRKNVIHGCSFEKGIDIDSASTALIEENDIWVEIEDPDLTQFSGGRHGISVFGTGPGPVTIHDNDIHDSLVGISVEGPAVVEITDNRIRDNESGIARINDSALVSGNTITGSSGVGLQIRTGSPTVIDNTISENAFGLSIAQAATPTLEGNTICDNTTNVMSVPSGDLPDLSGNEVCEDAPAE